MRRTLGDDIEGACGQLRNKELQGEKVVNKINPNIKPKPNRNTLSKVKDASQLLKQRNEKAASSRKDSRNNKDTRNLDRNAKISRNNRDNKSSKFAAERNSYNRNQNQKKGKRG